MWPSMATALTLSDTDSGFRFNIDPQTLAASVELAKGKNLIISSGITSAKISDLTQTDALITWQREGVQIEAVQEGDVFVVRFTRTTPSDITWPQTPSGAKALILPLFEGSYIPTMDKHW